MSPVRFRDQELKSVSGKTLFDYADSLKVRVPTSCGRTGECHECIVEIRRGMEALSPPTDAEGFLKVLGVSAKNVGIKQFPRLGR